MSEEFGTRAAIPAPPSASRPTGSEKNLPPLEPLVARLPEETRAALDELFRAKFIAVRRVPASVLEPASQ